MLQLRQCLLSGCPLRELKQIHNANALRFLTVYSICTRFCGTYVQMQLLLISALGLYLTPVLSFC